VRRHHHRRRSVRHVGHHVGHHLGQHSGGLADAVLVVALADVGRHVVGRARVRRLRIDRVEVGELVVLPRAGDAG